MQPNDKALKIVKLYEKLKSNRVNWDSHWRDIAEFVIPNKDNVYQFDRAPGEKKFNEIYDSTAIHSNELLGSALHGMLSNPTNIFFGLTTGNTQLDKNDEVRKWLQECVRRMHQILNNSNFQTEIHEVYLDIGSFGTGALFIDEDDTDYIRFLSHPIYQMYIDENYKGVVDTVVRCFKKPMKDILDEFGAEPFANDPMAQAMMSDPHKEYEIIHSVGANTEYNPYGSVVDNKPYYSCYVLKDKKIVLREKGYNTFPYAIPRWTKISGEKYGRSPAMKCLPDIKMINQMMKVTIRSAQKVVDPPLMAPDDGTMGPIRTAPGAINYYRAGTSDRIEPLQTGARIDFGFQIMEDVRTRIRSAFFIDQLQLREGPQMTATEVMQRTEEQLRLLGPILGRQHNELLKPLIDRIFDILYRRGQLPQAPQALAGMKLEVQYSSMIARAQKTSELESLNRMFQIAAPIFQVDQTVTDNFNPDAAFRYIANVLSVPYELLRDDKDVKKLREGRAQAAQQAQDQMAQSHEMEMMSKAAPIIQGQ